MPPPYHYYTSPTGWQAMMQWYAATLATFPSGVTCYHVTTRFGPTHLLAAGQADAPLLLLVHGSNVNALGWRHQITALSAHYRVIAPDVPGFAGRSAAMRLNDHNDDYAHWLADILDALAAPRALLAGSSSGGAFVLRFAARYPERCAGLVLINPAGIVRFRYPYAWFRHPRSTWLLGTLSRHILGYRWFARLMVRFGAGGNSQPDMSSTEMAYLLLRYFRRQPPPEVLPAQVLRQVDCRLLLLISDNDPYLHPQRLMNHALSLFPHAKIAILPHAGHDMHRDHPEVVNRRVMAFAEAVFASETA
ncbi:alpha/beta hydrolase [bacterium]|nr:alpha/beta hydrolase [bacterium]